MPQFEMNGKCESTFKALDGFTQGYIEAMFWTEEAPGVTTEEWQAVEARGDEHPEGSFPCDLGFYDLAPEALACIIADCKAFQEQFPELLDLAYSLEADGLAYTDERAGHDFWLTRNGHGCGFWSRTFKGERSEGVGDALTDCAEGFGETGAYLGDDGRIYAS